MSTRHRQWGDVERFDWAAGVARAASESGPRHGAFVSHDGCDFYLKGSTFPRHAGWRHALRSGLFRRPFPRRAEQVNLEWLRAHGFRAPRPVVSGAWWSGWKPAYQYLITERVEGVVTLDRALAERDAEGRAAVVRALAADLGRLHALGFVHRDVFARNLLVPVEGEPAIVWLDAWRGGPRRQRVGPRHDLACLASEQLLLPPERDLFQTTYGGAHRAEFP